MSMRQVGYVIALIALASLAGFPMYWKYVQADPAIVPDTRKDGTLDWPILNRNVDAKGRKLLAETARFAIAPPDWVPEPATTFAPGETMYILRNDCFFDKLAEPEVQRQMICEIGGTFDLGTIRPPKTTPSGRCSRANFATIIPTRIPAPNDCTYVAKVLAYKNPMQRSVEAPFAPVRVKLVAPAVKP